MLRMLRPRFRFALLVAPALAFALLVACGDDDALTTPTPDAGSSSDAALDKGGGDVAADTAPQPKPQLRCTQAELDQGDRTDAGAVEIVFNTQADPIQYTNHCVKLKVGSKATFK